jgi:ADP-ribose pyrophosphatase YjhB (NUDIX family)
MRLSTQPVNNLEELESILSSRNDFPRPYSVAVEALLFDQSGNWIMVTRGPASKDEVGKLEGIGGRFENEPDFQTALKREIVEEVGDDARIDILRPFEIRTDTVELANSPMKEKKHWIIVSYICCLRSGEVQVREPTKNSGFVRVPVDRVDVGKLSSSAQTALKSLRSEWAQVKSLLDEQSSS